MLDSKECFKCNCIKPLSAFYKHRGMKDGHLNKCIECTKCDVTAHRKSNLDKIREYDRERGKLPHRKQDSLDRTRKARGTITGYMSSHNAVAVALKNGSLQKQSCCMCGSIMSIAHHDDYTRPLDVMWLCTIHHKSRHFFLKYIGDEK